MVVVGEWIREYLHDPWGAVQALAVSLRDWANSAGPLGGPALAVVLGVLVGLRWWWRHRCEDRWQAHARMVTVLAPPTVDPAGAALLWANLTGLLYPPWRRVLCGQPHLVWEYGFSEQGTTIGIWVPGPTAPGLVEQAIAGAWPGAHTRTDPAGPPLPTPAPRRRWLVVAGALRLGRPEALPIRTDSAADPARALLAAGAGLGPHQHGCVQILTRPVTGRRVATARLAAHRIPTSAAHPTRRVLAGVLDLLTPGPTPRRPTSSSRGRATDPLSAHEHATQHRVITTKGRGSHYETVIRYAIALDLPATASTAQLRRARAVARGRVHALAAAFAPFTEHNRFARRRLPHPAQALAGRRLRRGDLLSIPELAAVAHLPLDPAAPGLARAGARAVAPPPGVAGPGPDAKPLGLTDAGPPRPVALRVPDARHHLHVLGATGSGKSTLLAQLILTDSHAERGVVVIDPKGDLVTDVLTRLPRRVRDRVVLIDADSPSRPPCLNPLHGGDTHRTVDNLISVFRRIYAAYWGPRTDDVLRAACLTLRTQPGTATLTDVARLLTEPAFRARVTTTVTDPMLAGFWTWYDDLGDAGRAQVIAPLMNKLRGLLLRPFVRATLAAGPSTVDLGAVLDGGVCLVRIPKGSLGEETARLVGSLVLAQAWQATTARAHIPQHQRPDASIVLDECHNFLTLGAPIEDMLAEARGMRVAMTLAHQHLTQLPRELRDAISTNARNKIFFTASPEDARDLAHHTTPQLCEHDLAHLGAYHAAARLIVRDHQTDPFTLRTRPLPPTRTGTRTAGRLRSSPTAARPSRHPVRAPARTHPIRRPASTDPRRTS
ncbi:MAG: type IV secretory system conjugative DNA transfer family protein [Pseudonocardiaceae bacterium]